MGYTPVVYVACQICKSPKLFCRGMCQKCYTHAYRTGQFKINRRENAAETFRASFQISEAGCWEWTGAMLKTGYGAIRDDEGKTARAHRFSYELHKGPITARRLVLHSCDNRRCVNPAHLRLGTHSDNMLDAIERKRIKMGRRAKLTTDQVKAIRALNGQMKQKDIASLFDISRSIVCQILSRSIWRDI